MQDPAAPPAAAPEADPHSRGAKRSALLIVFLVMFIDLLGFGIVLPLLPRYGEEFIDPLFPGESHTAAGIRGAVVGLLAASFSAMQFIFAPIWGRLSDRVGRRPFLILGLVGSVVFYALFGVASELGASPGRAALGLTLLFVARVGAGIAGATVSIAQAVIADLTSEKDRAHGMALIGMAFGIGFTFGPAIAAGCLRFVQDVRAAPGYIASGFSLIALVIALTIMPETLRPGVTAGRRGILNLRGVREALRMPAVGTLILIFFCTTLAFAAFEPTLALLTRDILGYGDRDNFLVFAYVGLVLALAQGGLYRPLSKRGIAEANFILVGLCLMALGLGGIGVTAYTRAQVSPDSMQGFLLPFLLAATLAVAGFSFINPSVSSLISRRCDLARQGEVLGVNQSANALSRILGPLSGLLLYFLTPTHVLPNVFMLGLLLVAFALTLRVRQA